MIIPFYEMDKNSRIWVFQSNRKFFDDELVDIEKSLSIFLENWTAHKAELKVAYTIKYDRFIIIALDESINCLLYTSPSPRDRQKSRMPSSA